MKIQIKSLCLLCFAAGSLTLSSCEDFLDRQEDESMTFEKIWERRGTVEQYWNNAMSFMPTTRSSFVGDYDPYLGASDECTIAYDRGYRYINFGSWNASTVPYYYMGHFYQGIRECNIFMQNVYSCSDPLAEKTQLDKWYWQARFARAYYYYRMMRDYGPVFLLGDELLDFSASTADLYRPRNTWEQCVDYVVSEMTTCAESDAIKEAYEESEYGLATKGTCYAVISRLLLYSARDLFNGNKLYSNVKNPIAAEFPELSGVNLFPQTYDANKWLKAADAAKKVIDMGIYKLYRAGNGDPYEDYNGVLGKTWNSELIFTDGYKARSTLAMNVAPTSLGGTAYGAVGPTQQQVDAYAMSNGRYPIVGYNSDGSPVVDKQSGYDAATELEKSKWTHPRHGWSKHADKVIESPNMYKDREPRFYVSVYWGGSEWLYLGGTAVTSFAKNGNGNKSHDFTKSGYLINRFYDHNLSSVAGNWGNVTFPEFRLAEIYLNFIEAVYECKKHNVALPAGYETLAMTVWNDIRDRAGVPDILDVYPNATTEELIELCRKERRIELAFESHRYFDTRTWMIAEETDGGPMYGMNTDYPQENKDDLSVTPDGYWERYVFETRVFKKNHYLYPFSQRELDRNRLLTQNYGW